VSDREPPDGAGFGADDEDPGDPVPEIAGLRETADPRLLARVRSGIQRRMAAAEWLDFLVSGVLQFLLELGTMIFGATSRPRETGERSDE
jgi:hypothetical protein